ncbi:MAG: hypothetical protein QNK03_06720 [Myxococcota bacterium]|nr:hypothetical protein [Myxococcota bacterium]
MEGEGALFIVVEFSVGLAGFGGIIVALRRSIGDQQAAHKFEFTDLLSVFANSLGAAFLALVPVALNFLEVQPASIWRISSALIVALQLGLTGFGQREVRRLREPLPLYYRRFAWMGGGIILLVQVSNVVGFPWAPGIALFFLGLLWHMLFAAIGFVRLVIRHAS